MMSSKALSNVTWCNKDDSSKNIIKSKKHPVKSIAINMWAPAWYEKSILNFDANKVAEHCSVAGIEVVFLWQGFSQDHFGEGFYPSTKLKRHPNLAAGRNHMTEIVSAMHKYGIKVVSYYSYKDKTVWDREADWRQISQDGTAYAPKSGGGGTGRFGDLCPNSPYREYVIERQTELLERFDIDGASLLDSAYFAGSGCYCKYCRKKFKTRYGLNIPVYTGEWTQEWSRYTAWKAECIQEMYDDLKMAHRKIRPGFPLSHLAFGCRGDYEGNAGLNFENMTGTDSFVNSITQWNEGLGDGTVHRDPGFRWVAGMTTRYLKAVSDKDVTLHIGRFTYDREFQCMPVHELEVAIDSIVAAGGNPSIADNLFPDGSIDEQAYKNITEIYKRLDDREKFLTQGRPVCFAGIWYSKESLDYCGCVYPGENRYYDSVEGAYKFCIEHHYPVEFVCDRHMDEEYLSQYKLLILPCNTVISDEQADSIRHYVSDGGTIISQGSVGILGHNARMRDNFVIADVIGTDYRYPSIYSIHYYSIPDRELIGKSADEGVLIFRGDQCVNVPHGKSDVLSTIVLPASERSGDQRAVTFAMDMHPGEHVDIPGIILNQYGQGKSIWFAGNIFENYGIYGYVWQDKVLNDAVSILTEGTLPFTVLGPKCVETSGWTDKNELKIHFVNYAFDGISTIHREGGRMAEYHLPISGMRLFLPCAVDTVREVMDDNGDAVEWTNTEKNGKEGVDIKVPTIEEYLILVVTTSAGKEF